MCEGRIKVKIRQCISGEIIEEEVIPIYRCHHVNDRKYYPELKEVKFIKESEYIIVESPNSCYGFSALWLKDRKNKIYEWDGFGHSGACSVICSLLQEVVKNENKDLLNA